jgi:FHA domain
VTSPACGVVAWSHTTSTPGTMRALARRIGSLIGEFSRRGVFKIVAAYAVVAWGASLAATDLLPAFGAPEWTVRAFIIVAMLGLPIAAALAWIYELTLGGIVRDPGTAAQLASAEEEAPAGSTTLLFGSTDSVRARWEDTVGSHERVFFKAFRIGRDESCELHFDDPLVSRRHAEVRLDDGRWWVVDLGSRNGTRLDGRLVERALLPPVCSLQFYDTAPLISLELGGPSAAITVASRPGVHPVE